MGVADYDVELDEAVSDLVADLTLVEGSAAYGIAQKVVHEGYQSLSPKQRTFYDAVVAPALERHAREIEAIQLHNLMMANP